MKKSRKEYYKLYCSEHKDKKSEYDKEYYKIHSLEKRIARKERYLKNREEILRKCKEYASNHKNERNNYYVLYRVENKEKITKSQNDWVKNNKVHRLKYFRKYKLERRRKDIKYKILCNLRCRLFDALKRNSKSESTLKLLGCSIDFLKQHLESQFKTGMTWKNYGKWHIDHIKPCAKFDMSKPSEQRKCFHYTNLQPLWAKDNLIKNRF